MSSRTVLSILALTTFAIFVSACSDRYRNPADDPRNQTSTTVASDTALPATDIPSETTVVP